MKQRISVNQYKDLSKEGLLRWRAWCIDEGYGSVFDEGEFVEVIQPSIGELLDYCKTNNIEFTITQDTPHPVDYLWILVASHLENE